MTSVRTITTQSLEGFRWLVAAFCGCALLVGCGASSAKPDPLPVLGESGEPESAVMLRFMLTEGDKWREVTDPTRIAHFQAMADNQPAQLALALYAEAWDVAPPTEFADPTLFIGIKPGGNFARTGFTIIESSGATVPLPNTPFLILDDKPDRFRVTFLHETGHVIHGLLARGADENNAHTVAPIPHSTAAVTDRRTAFNEGWAIHLETINAHCGTARQTRVRYDRLGFTHGIADKWQTSEYYSPIADMRSYSQNFARYWMVRDGLFSFEPAVGGDYLRVQLDPARDRKLLRSASAMLASEGFVASVFFHLIASEGCPLAGDLAKSYRPVFEALRIAETQNSSLDAAPIAEVAAGLGETGIRVFLDLSRGATMDREAGGLWARFYDTSIQVDRTAEGKVIEEIEARRRSWEDTANAEPSTLLRGVGPVIVVETPNREVGLSVFGEPRPMSFDVNAAGQAVLRLVPNITEKQVQSLIETRSERYFASYDDFSERTKRLGITGLRLRQELAEP